MSITEKSKQEERKTILNIVKKGIYNTYHKQSQGKANSQKAKTKTKFTIRHDNKWVTFTYSSPIIIRITDLFKQINLNIAFRATNTIQQQVTKKQTDKNPSGIYKLKCNTRNTV